MTNKNILDYWPITSPPRPNQVRVLNWLAEQTAKYVICEMPVGSGKSLVGLTYARYLSGKDGSSFILTPQRILQHQYEQTLGDKALFSLYGKGNYKCSTKSTTCDVGSAMKPRCKHCPHRDAIGSAKKTPNVVLNYKLAMLLFGYTEVFEDTRKLMVLDECHTLEEHLTEFGAISINRTKTFKMGIQWKFAPNVVSAFDWVRNVYLPGIRRELSRVFGEIEPLLDKPGVDLTRAEQTKLKQYAKLEDHVDEVAEFALTNPDVIANTRVLVHDKENIKFKHLTGVTNFDRLLDGRTEQYLFMSSTIINHEGFCRDVGLPLSDVAFLSIDSDFPPENRPVVYMPQMKMNSTWNKPENHQSRHKMVDTIKQILTEHGGESGIIHTGNFLIASWLVEHLDGKVPQQILHHNPDSGDDRNAIINQFGANPKPSVLISPSITEGLDLKDDLGRFAIIAKIPFGNLGDQWIKRRLEMSGEWYQRRALIDVIQGGGRVVRSSEDEGIVYILDGSWDYLYSQTIRMVPNWWKQAYHVL